MSDRSVPDRSPKRKRAAAYRACRLARAAGLVVALLTLGCPAATPSLEQSFAQPPQAAKPWVYWFWSDGNITRAGITADLEAMQRVGIGGVLIMEVDQNVPPGPVRFMTRAWREMFAFAVSEAARLGLKINLNNDAGWTGSGGPWVTAADSMQKVVSKELRLSGPRTFDGELARPESVAGHYRDIALLAFPTPPTEARGLRESGAEITSSAAGDFRGGELIDGNVETGITLPRTASGAPAFVQFSFPAPYEVRSLEIVGPARPAQRAPCELEVSDDGVSFRSVARHQVGAAPRTFAPVRGRVYRLVFPAVAKAAEPLRLNEIVLSSVHRIDSFTAKSGLGLASAPDEVVSPGEGVAVPRATIVDLTTRLQGDRLTWNVPPGDWTLVRLGHTSTGKNNYPSMAEGRGLEVDKLNSAAFDRHYDAFVGKLIGVPGANGTLTTVHIDSWEVRYQNWTPGFREAFTRLRGYDPVAWLPTFTGRVVENAGLSERFLWDVRRTISELLNDHYAGRMAARTHESGRTFSLQAYRNGPFDCLSYAGRADLPIAEFWITRDPASLHPSVKTMTSAGHIYGKPVIAAEAFTASDAMGRQRNHPYSMKAIGDAAFCAGVNQFIFHRYSLQPWTDDRKPGMTMGPWGVEYERTATWWEQTKPWHEYLARCQHLLQQGTFVADLCYLQNEEGINNPTTMAELRPKVPEGYDFDFCADELVSRMTVKDGRIHLPGGMSYRVLVLPQQRLMTPDLLRAIRELVRQGAIVFGASPRHSPSLRDYPECDAEVKRLVNELWLDCDCDPATKLERSVGQGKVIWGPSLEQLLTHLKLERDFATRSAPAHAAAPRIRYVHRSLSDREVYFVANLSDARASVVASFRAEGTPELWQAETGAIATAPVYEVAAGRTRVPLELAPRGSVFVVLRKSGSRDGDRLIAVKQDDTALLEAGDVSLTLPSAEPKPFADVIGTFTFAAWVRPAEDTTLAAEDFGGTGAYSVPRNDLLFPPPGHEVFGRNDAAGAGLAVGRNGVSVLEHGDHHFTTTLTHRAALTDWTHVAVVFVDGTPTLYLNGTAVRTGLRTPMTVHGGVDVPHNRDTTPFHGDQTALQQFARALTAEEIRGLMERTPRTPMAAPVRSQPVPPPRAGAPALLLAGKSAWISHPGRYEFATARGPSHRLTVDQIPAAQPVPGPWQLRFPAGWGAPSNLELTELRSWSLHPDAGVRHFSGTGTYHTSFAVAPAAIGTDRRTWLDLGDVQVIAEVKLNGRELATLWKPPFRVEVTDALRAGRNELEVRVTNLWVNRLIGDEHLPADREWTKVPRRNGWAVKAYPDWLQRGEKSPTGRITFATWKHYEKNAPLLPSGLLGPVMLHTAVKLDLP